MNNYTRTGTKVTQEELKALKLTAPQAQIVLQAIDNLKTGTLEDIVKETEKLGMISKSNQGNKMVVRWYLQKSLIPNKLVISEAIKIEKKIKTPVAVTPKKEKATKEKVVK